MLLLTLDNDEGVYVNIKTSLLHMQWKSGRCILRYHEYLILHKVSHYIVELVG